MPNLTTIAAWAATLGISRQQGYAAITRCEIPVTDGKVDAEYATLLYHRNTRPRANGKRTASMETVPPDQRARETEGRVPSYDASRARTAAAEARMAERRDAEEAGLYLVKSDVDSAVFEVMRALRDGLMNCSRRVAAEVAMLASADECEAVIDREHRAMLESLRHGLLARVGAGADADESAE